MMTWVTTLWDNAQGPLPWGVVIGASMIAAFLDVRSRRIPNRLTGPLLLAGFVWAAWIAGWAGLADSLAGCLIAGVPFVVMFALCGGGAGDAKMMGAIGAWLGVIGAGVTLVLVLLAGGVLAVGYAAWKRHLPVVLGNVSRMSTGLLVMALGGRKGWSEVQATLPRTTEMKTMPYGLAILSGVLLAALGAYVWHG